MVNPNCFWVIAFFFSYNNFNSVFGGNDSIFLAGVVYISLVGLLLFSQLHLDTK